MRISLFDEVFGRLGNRMFQSAFLYAYAKKHGLNWYYQDPKWFEGYEEEIKQLFGDGIGFLPYVSIHVRRGDYANNPFYVDLAQTDYYLRALDHFPNKNFLVFSDNTEFCKNFFLFKGKNFQIMENQTEIEDFNQMASCEGNIISNSSFSWWAAYLNPNPARKVVAPSVENWHTDGIERTVCPLEWIRI